MASLFSSATSEKTAAKAGHARPAAAGASGVTGSPLKPTAAASRAAMPATATSPAVLHGTKESRDSRPVAVQQVAASGGTVQHNKQHTSVPNAESKDRTSAAKNVAGRGSTGQPAEQTVPSSSDANSTAGLATQTAVESRRDATRQLFDVLLQDDRFLDAVADAFAAVGLQ